MRKHETTEQPRKMSDIMKEMSERLYRNPNVAHSSEAFHVALFFANVAWNECVGLGGERKGGGDERLTVAPAAREVLHESLDYQFGLHVRWSSIS